MDDGESFGERMARLKRERGESGAGPGRRPIAEKHSRLISAAERIFAIAMPDEAERYVEELEVKDPEFCPDHHTILRCVEPGCATVSRRTAYNHKAAAYLFDRIMGKPTNRTENTVTVRLVQQWTVQIAAVFLEANDIDDALARREAFAEGCDKLALLYAGNAGAA